MNSPRYTSRVKFFDRTKGYGFILPVDHLLSDLFLSESEISDNYCVEKGDIVEFSIKDTRRGKMAANVILVRKKDELPKSSKFLTEDL